MAPWSLAVRLTLPRLLRAQEGMVILGSAGDRFVVPYAPNQSDTDGLAPTYNVLERPQRMALVQRAAPGLPAWGFELLLQKPDYLDDVMVELAALARLVQRSDTVTVSRGPGGPGVWVIDGFSVHVERLTGDDNRIAEATVAMHFVRASAAKVAVGPVSGGVGKPAAPPPGPAAPAPPSPAPKSHTIAGGDTLYGLAVRYCGSGAKWTAIADANGIKDPRKLRIGQVLTIPC